MYQRNLFRINDSRFCLTRVTTCITLRYMTSKTNPQGTIRWNAEDRKLITALRKKLGVQSISDLMRQALRALAAKEGVTV